MATQVQFRRGTTTQNNAFTGAVAEITYDSDAKTLRLHDGTTAGGGATVVTLAATQTLTNKTLSTSSVWQGNAIGLLYGGTGSGLTAVAGGVVYSGASSLAISGAGTSGQVLISGGAGAPSWVAATTLTVGTATNATTATNLAGGSAGQLHIQTALNTTGYIAAGANGTFLQSQGAGNNPTWAAGAVTYGTTTVSLGASSTSITGLTAVSINGTGGSLGVGTASSGTAGEIRATNQIVAYYTSDRRLKENIVNIENPIEKVQQLNGVTYDWTDDYITKHGGADGYFVRKQDIGLISQDVERVMPQIVAENNEGFLAIKYERVVALLVEAVKEQQKQIDELKARLGN
jgi:hypothetical protein